MRLRKTMAITILLSVVLVGCKRQAPEDEAPQNVKGNVPRVGTATPEGPLAKYFIPVPDGSELGEITEGSSDVDISFRDPTEDPRNYENLIIELGWGITRIKPSGSGSAFLLGGPSGLEGYSCAVLIYGSDGAVEWSLYKEPTDCSDHFSELSEVEASPDG